ncbi:DNA-processing protein DprA [Acidaminococcus sp.]|uniref:DNA-processing protein DprA n=1 Tax=Acidaminococcus sp. TaxID=1872103 RepID=UPI003D7DF720
MEEIYCAALADLLGYGAAQWVPRFFAAFGSYERAYKASRKEVASRGLLTPFLEKSWGGQRWNSLPERVYDYVQTHPVELLTCQSAGYPELLRQLSLPPAILYVKGRLPDSGQGLAIVGSRKATDYGLGAAAQFSRAAALEGIPVYSGGAYGIDGAAHKAAAEAGGVTVAVLGGGLGKLYPSRHLHLFDRICEKGALVTEFAPWEPPLAPQFLQRNRIIVGLSKAILVVEAGTRSGALNTARTALDENRELFAVPGPITSATSQGTNGLIKQGARLADAPRDVLDFLQGREAGAKAGAKPRQLDLFPELKPEERPRAKELIDWLKKQPGQTLDTLADTFPWPLDQLSMLLMELELAGRIQRTSRNRYIAV